VLGAIIAAAPAPQRELSALARRARVAYMSAGETIVRALAEPGRRGDAQVSESALGAARRIVSVVHVLRSDVQEERESEPLPELRALAEDLDRTLARIEARLRGDVVARAAGKSEELPELRESYRRLAQTADLERTDVLLARELDELVDAVNSLAALVLVADA
jgi:hypothetical protein